MTTHINRRRVLQGIATGAAFGLGAETAGASAEAPERHIVGTETKAATEKAKREASTVHRVMDFGDIGWAVAGEFPEQVRRGIERRSDVKYVEADGQMEALGQTLPWGVDRIGADEAQDAGYTGDGAHVAILDTGIDSDHPDLGGNLGSGKAFVSCDDSCHSNDCKQPWDDDGGHGTHCAGIASAVDNSASVVGVSSRATLHAVKVLGCSGYGYYSDIAGGLKYVADEGWDVASMSLGGTSSSRTLRDACQYAADRGVLVVAAAGNSGPCSDCVLYPAKYDTVVAVSATTSSDSLASYSCTGPEIEFAAPGSAIPSTVPGGVATYSGTSMACPHVSGAAGVVMSTGVSAAEARSSLADAAEDLGLGANEQGSGLVDVQTAVGASAPEGDTTAPAAPSNLTVASQTDTSVELSWDASSDDSGVAHYNVYVDGTKDREVSETSTTVDGLSSGTNYGFYVTAVDGSGNESAASNVVTQSTSGTSITPIGEAGSETITQPDAEKWFDVTFSKSYVDPVVIVGPLSYNGGNPAHVRLRDVTGSGFQFKVEEWKYLDDYHTEESFDWIVVEAGSHTLENGTNIEAGTFSVNSEFSEMSYSVNFSNPPVVLSTSQTYRGYDPITTRQRNISSNRFEVMVQEEESRGAHVVEEIGYLAIEPSSGTIDNQTYEAKRVDSVTSDWRSIDFVQNHTDKPIFIVQMHTFAGANTAGLRYRNTSSEGVDVLAEEERSRDSEVVHIAEEIGYFALGGGIHLYAKA